MAKKKEQRRVSVPKNLDEAAAQIATVAALGRRIDQIANALNEQVERLKEAAMAEAAGPEAELEDAVLGLFEFAEANRKTLELTDKDERKSCSLPTGVFGWRWNPPKVTIRDEEQVLKDLEKLGLTRFIREKPEVNKQAMLDDRETAETVKGVKISQIEHFYVKPTESKVAIEKDAAKLRKEIAS